MGGCRCSWKSCKNTTKAADNIHFFHYPVKHKERCKKWIENACKPQFCDLEEEQLRNKVICEKHFEDRFFPNSQRKRLLQGAIPTLDCTGDEEPQPNLPIVSRQVSSPLSDLHVQILPANEDGTIFLLDTDFIHRRVFPSQQVESYTYKNGAIVPSYPKYNANHGEQIELASNVEFGQQPYGNNSEEASQGVVLMDFKDMEQYNQNNDSNIEYTIEEEDQDEKKPLSEVCQEVIMKDVVKHPKLDPGRSSHSTNSHSNSTALTNSHNVRMVTSTPNMRLISNPPTVKSSSMNHHNIVDHSQSSRTHHQTISESKPTSSSTNTNPTPTIKKVVQKQPSVIENSVSRNYLRKIKQHSRDIATIKRMLKRKSITEPSITAVLSSLKKQLPASLYSVVNFCLNRNCVISDEDKDFYNTMYTTSPDMYKLLVEKYNWKLPNPNDIVVKASE